MNETDLRYASLNDCQELAVGVYEFLCEIHIRYHVHPVLHMGMDFDCTPAANCPLPFSDAWISVIRPSKYVEIHFERSSPEVRVEFFLFKEFRRISEPNSSYSYNIEGNFRTCDRCRDSYLKPYVDCNLRDEEFVDLTVPSSLAHLRKLVLMRLWH